MMNWNGFGSGQGKILRYYPGICMEGLRETTKNLTHDSWSLGPDFNPRPPTHSCLNISIKLSYIQHCDFENVSYTDSGIMMKSTCS
jgi:hypothetical protein